MTTSTRDVEKLLLGSIDHRLGTAFKPHSMLAARDRDLRILLFMSSVRDWRKSWLLEMNVLDMNPLGEVNCPDAYAKTKGRRDRLWAFLLKTEVSSG